MTSGSLVGLIDSYAPITVEHVICFSSIQLMQCDVALEDWCVGF